MKNRKSIVSVCGEPFSAFKHVGCKLGSCSRKTKQRSEVARTDCTQTRCLYVHSVNARGKNSDDFVLACLECCNAVCNETGLKTAQISRLLSATRVLRRDAPSHRCGKGCGRKKGAENWQLYLPVRGRVRWRSGASRIRDFAHAITRHACESR